MADVNKFNVNEVVQLLKLAHLRHSFIPKMPITDREYFLLAKLVVYFCNQNCGVKFVNDVNEVSIFSNDVIDAFSKTAIRLAIDTYQSIKPEWANHWKSILLDSGTSSTRFHELRDMYQLVYKCACIIQLAPENIDMPKLLKVLDMCSENTLTKDFPVYLSSLIFVYSALNS